MLKCKLKKKLRNFAIDIELEIGSETLVLIGHSGCGKSTTLQMLAGLLEPDEGVIELDGQVLWDGKGVNVPPEERKVGYVFQNYALFPHLSVAKNIAYGLSHLDKAERNDRVASAIELLRLQGLENSKPAQLSGGEQQRVALARAIVTEPKFLLLDEPLSALDVSLRAHVRNELKSLLQKLAIPVIVVTHDYEDAKAFAKKIAVIDCGMIVQTGEQKEMSLQPVNQFVADFIGTDYCFVPVRACDMSSGSMTDKK